MNYSSRIGVAATVALGVHILFLAIGWSDRTDREFDLSHRVQPIVLNLSPPEERPIRQLVESGAPSDDDAKPTDLISDESSRAQDQSEESKAQAQPKFEEPDEFDALGREAVTQPPAQAMEAAPPAPEIPPETAAEEAAEPVEPKKTEPMEPKDGDVVLSSESFEGIKAEPAEESVEEAVKTEEPDTKELPESFEVARADPQEPHPPLVESIGVSRGRDAGGAEDKGDLSFDANKHALGEYMLNVRRQVERAWRTSLQFKYTGTSRATATLECSIRPDGFLEHVKILDRGVSVIYAALCKQAIERAAPFGPFPFDVPLSYRSENLVIRWKFSYL